MISQRRLLSMALLFSPARVNFHLDSTFALEKSLDKIQGFFNLGFIPLV